MNAAKTLLLCEDDPFQLRLLAASFARAGYRTVDARSPSEALRKASLETVDAVLADVQLESGSAFDLIRDVRRSAPGLPILLASAYVTPALRDRAGACGALGLIEKTGSVLDLVRRAETALRDWFQGKRAGRILLVDGHGPSRAVEAAILEDSAFEVLQAETSEGAIEALHAAAAPVDLVVLDLTVTGSTGADLVRRLRAIDRSVGVVALAGSASQEEIVAAYHAGASSLLRKPFSEQGLLQAVRVQMRIARQERSAVEQAAPRRTSWPHRLARGARRLMGGRTLLGALLAAAMVPVSFLVLEAAFPPPGAAGAGNERMLENRIIDEMRRFNAGYQKELRWNGIEK